MPAPYDPMPLDHIPVQALTSYNYVQGDGEEKWVPPNSPLFRFGAPRDLIVGLVNVKDRVMFKVFSNLVEFVIMEGADEYDLAMAMWLISHCQGHLFVNSPTQEDPKKLVHIANVTEKSRVADLVRSIATNLVRYPSHFVLETTFDTQNSIFGSLLLNKHSVNRIYKAVKNDYLDRAV